MSIIIAIAIGWIALGLLAAVLGVYWRRNRGWAHGKIGDRSAQVISLSEHRRRAA